MTAFSKTHKRLQDFDIVVELQSVNRKHLDIQCFLPVELRFLENTIRKIISKIVVRGQILVKVFVHYRNESPNDVCVDVALAKKLYDNALSLTKILCGKEEAASHTLVTILQREDVVRVVPAVQVSQKLEKAVLSIVEESTYQLDKMRVREGKHLQKEFSKRLLEMKKWVRIIAKKWPSLLTSFQNRLCESPLYQGNSSALSVDQQLAIYRDKIDISEEMSRFTYHIEHIFEAMKEKSSSGKLIEFILQELLREANTMGSKVQEVSITKHVVLIKNEIEKIREQVQNVE